MGRGLARQGPQPTAPVIHAAEIARLADRIRESTRSPARTHTLLIGPRGSGKTFVVNAAVQRVLAQPRLGRRVAVAWVPEDAVAVSTYADLLHEIDRQLSGPTPESAELRRQRAHVRLERRIGDALAGRVLVLVLENLHHVFAGLGRTGAGALRGYVESSGDVLVLATTPRVFRDVTSRDEPWFGNFAAERLDPLTMAQGEELLRAAAAPRGAVPPAQPLDPEARELLDYLASEDGRARVRALAHLVGDSIRLWQLVGATATADTLDAFDPVVRTVCGSLAAYFTCRLAGLSGDQQSLVLELARGPGAQSVQELAAAAGQDPRVTATTLRRLTDAYVVTAAKVPGTDRRTTWYELREPLLRLHLQYQQAEISARTTPALGASEAAAAFRDPGSRAVSPGVPGPSGRQAWTRDESSPGPRVEPSIASRVPDGDAPDLHPPDLVTILRDWHVHGRVDAHDSDLAVRLRAAAEGDRTAYAHLSADLRALVDSGSG